jgi:hypothetical protein
MSEGGPQHYIVSIPYSLCDALLSETLMMHLHPITKVVRRTLTAGSCVYRFGQLPAQGLIYLRETFKGQTCIDLMPHPAGTDQATELLIYLAWLVEKIKELDQDDNRLPLDAAVMHTDGPLFIHDIPKIAEVERKARTTKGRKRPGRKTEKINDWARARHAAGATIDELLPEYARQRKMNLVEARELLRHAITGKNKRNESG